MSGDSVLLIEQGEQSREFGASGLPLTIGSGDHCDVRLTGVTGSIQIGLLDDVFFVQPARDTTNVRVDGRPVQGSRKLTDGALISFDTARMKCLLRAGRLHLRIDAQMTAGDTAPPDLEDLVRADARRGEEIAITPIAFSANLDEESAFSRFRPSRATVGVIGAFLILGVLGWFAFTAKSVEILLEPPVEEISLPSTVFKFRVGDRFLLRSGTHRIAAELEGYFPIDQEFEVGDRSDQSVTLEFVKLPGLITLTTNPEVGAEVSVDGEVIGITPIEEAELRPGEHDIVFSAERFLDETLSLDVIGEGKSQSLTASLTPDWSPVTVTTSPAGADVIVDGTVRGNTPLVVELVQGEHQVEVRLRGHNAWSDDVEVEPNTPIELPTVTLVEADGRVRLASEPSAAAVRVNGEFEGQTPITLTLRPGRTHQIVLSKPGFEPVVRELSVAADSGRSVNVEMPPLFGEVRVVTEPPGAEVLVDAEVVGSTPGEFTLSALPHVVEVRRTGFAPDRAEVTPRPDYPALLEFELEALDDLSGGGYPSVIRTGLGQELRIVPAGDFTMGTSRREPDRRSNEVLRDVSLSRAFYLGAHEVTNAEFRRFRESHNSGDFAGHSLNDDDQPVVNVSWADVVQFLNFLSINDALQPVYQETAAGWVAAQPLRNGYRLPTEAEWAWAARFANQEEPLYFPWGNDLPPPDRSGNYADIAAADILPTTLSTYSDGFPVSAPVGSFDRNALGVYDLGGNVAEWIHDFYELTITTSEEPLVDPLGPERGTYHVVRGTSWKSASERNLRVAYRDYSTGPREDLGFRIARDLD